MFRLDLLNADGLAALWISGRLGERIREKDPNRLADRVSRLYVDSVLRTMAL